MKRQESGPWYSGNMRLWHSRVGGSTPPGSTTHIMSIIFGIIGLLVISFAIWVRREQKQDILFVIGGIALLVYSINIGNIIFIILQIVFIVSALFEILRLKKKNK